MPILRLDRAVGKGCPNTAGDIRSVATALMDIDKLPRSYPISGGYDDAINDAIVATQHHWMLQPDAVISVGGRTQTYIQAWSIKPIDAGVQLPSDLRKAWDLVNPLLPPGSYCSSGQRSADDQRRILHEFFLRKYKSEILEEVGQAEYTELSKNLLANEARVLELVRGTGHDIAAPGGSKHQLGKAADIAGPSPARRAEITRMVARANPQLFLAERVRLETNGCVHFEIR